MKLISYKKTKNYEVAVGNALSGYLSHYKTGSIDRSLTQVTTDRKIYFGEAGRAVNYFARDFQELSKRTGCLWFSEGRKQPLDCWGVQRQNNPALEP
ncbi:hypothetical protein [Paenibacillus planticolens]|uniref:hypothetical protein n=1 Tax=Paenibacillus planticolens TaxID=2654976 RepID=UPI0014917C11|nr:hypothetical protein [Paenibacillus planticolens]